MTSRLTIVVRVSSGGGKRARRHSSRRRRRRPRRVLKPPARDRLRARKTTRPVPRRPRSPPRPRPRRPPCGIDARSRTSGTPRRRRPPRRAARRPPHPVGPPISPSPTRRRAHRHRTWATTRCEGGGRGLCRISLRPSWSAASSKGSRRITAPAVLREDAEQRLAAGVERRSRHALHVEEVRRRTPPQRGHLRHRRLQRLRERELEHVRPGGQRFVLMVRAAAASPWHAARLVHRSHAASSPPPSPHGRAFSASSARSSPISPCSKFGMQNRGGISPSASPTCRLRSSFLPSSCSTNASMSSKCGEKPCESGRRGGTLHRVTTQPAGPPAGAASCFQRPRRAPSRGAGRGAGASSSTGARRSRRRRRPSRSSSGRRRPNRRRSGCAGGDVPFA